jgi:hypothetical protein
MSGKWRTPAVTKHGIASMDCPAVSADHGVSNATSADSQMASWRRLGEIVGLQRRELGSAEPSDVDQLSALEGIGLQGDKHAHELSPRQVLVAGVDAYVDLGLKPKTLRENLLVNFPTKDLRSGGLAKVGHEVLLWLTFQCEACGHLDHHHPGVVRHIDGRRGMLARVLRSGRIAVGDEVTYLASAIPPFADLWQDRIASILSKVPDGKYLEYRQLARLAGVPRAYCRAFPKVLSKLPSNIAERAVAGEVKEKHRRWIGNELFDVSRYLNGVAALNLQ